MGFLIPNNNTIQLMYQHLSLSLVRPYSFLNLVPVRLYHQFTFRKNGLLDSSCMGGNHIHMHVHNY